MNNYQNGKIYKLIDNSSDMIYIGSTCKTLPQRLRSHETDYIRYKAGKQHYITSYKILENNNYKIELLKLYPCENKRELDIEEGKITKQLKNDKLNIVNRNIAGQNHIDSCAQYRQINKHKINQKHNCSCGGKYTSAGKSQHVKTKKHCDYINKSKTINIETLNITINVNKPEEINKIDLLNIVK